MSTSLADLKLNYALVPECYLMDEAATYWSGTDEAALILEWYLTDEAAMALEWHLMHEVHA